MSDELLLRRLRANASWGDDRFSEAADRIEQLTADKRFIIEERDRTFALMLARAEAAEAERDQWIAHTKNAVWADSEELKLAEAERDRLRKELEKIVDDCEAEYPPSHGAIKYAARMALKGE